VGSSQNITIVSVSLAGVVSVAVTGETWDLFDTMVGIILLLVLFAYADFVASDIGSLAESLAVSTVVGFCIVMIAGPWIEMLPAFSGVWKDIWFVVIWVMLSVVAYVSLDRGYLARIARWHPGS
jgi:hypothetical protein